MTNEQKEKIKKSSYRDLLEKWRFAPVGDPIFQGEDGEFYSKVMFEKKAELSASEQVAASKSVGWD